MEYIREYGGSGENVWNPDNEIMPVSEGAEPHAMPPFAQRDGALLRARVEPESQAVQRAVNWGGYRAWQPHSSIKLMSVPWGSNYRDVVEFADKQARDEWFERKNGITVENMSMLNYGEPVRIDRPYGEVMQYNYCRIVNPYSFVEPADTKTATCYYYFVTSARIINPSCTEITVQLDAWTTYYYDTVFGRSYVKRGHIGIANENAWADNGRRNLDIPEGLDTGAGYRYTNLWYSDVASKSTSGWPSVVVMSTIRLDADPGTVSDPKLRTATANVTSGVPSGAEMYIIPPDARDGTPVILRFWEKLSEYPWVSQGILSMHIVDTAVVAKMQQAGKVLQVPMLGDGSEDILWYVRDMDYVREKYFYDGQVAQWSHYRFPDRYKTLVKFLIYPYTWVQLALSTGENMCIKEQELPDGELNIVRRDWLGAPQASVWLHPKEYAGSGGKSSNTGQYIEIGNVTGDATRTSEMPQLLTVSDQTSMYTASNAHSIQNARENADWSQQKAMMSARNAYSNTVSELGLTGRENERAMQLANSQTALQNDTRNQQLELSKQKAWADYGLNTVPSAIGSALSGNIGGAIGQAIGGAASTAASNYFAGEQNSIANATANSATEMSNANRLASTNDAIATRTGVADANKTLAAQVAAGDYAQTINQINAKIQDSQLTPPNMLGSMGGETPLFAIGEYRAYVRFMQLSDGAMRNIGETWLRYGYMIQRYMRLPERLCCMTRFAYWQCADVTLSDASRVPEELRMTLRGILEQGVTVWQRPEDIANVDVADNIPYYGYSY